MTECVSDWIMGWVRCGLGQGWGRLGMGWSMMECVSNVIGQ